MLQADSSKGAALEGQEKAQGSAEGSGSSRFGFGTQLFQKTVGLVLRPRPGKEVVILYSLASS